MTRKNNSVSQSSGLATVSVPNGGTNSRSRAVAASKEATSAGHRPHRVATATTTMR